MIMNQRITDELIAQAVARGWCHPSNSGKEMDADLARAISDEVRAVLALAAQQGEPFGWWFTEDPAVLSAPGSGFRRYPDKPQHTVECIALYTAPAPQGDPYGWAVTGCHSLYRGEWAESTAQAEARRCGGTAVAFPLYTAPAPAPAVPSDELRIARGAIRELEQKVFSQEQAIAVLRASVARYQRDMEDPPAYLQDAVIRAAGLGAMAEEIAALKKKFTAAPTPPAKHPDDAAVDRFASAMKAKLAASRAKGRGGWDDPEQCSVEHLARLLVEHVAKGDPVDVANFAMMLHQRGADHAVLTSAQQPAAPTLPNYERAAFEQQMSQRPLITKYRAHFTRDRHGVQYKDVRIQGHWITWRDAIDTVRKAALPQRDCPTCNGHGLIGGHMQDGSGYGEGCPDCNPEPSVPEDVARVNKQMLEALEDVLSNCLDPEGLANAYKKARAAIDAARKP